ncbi:hypothetical protein P22_0690 [Propionispora sp. 2/2-37]|uniref:4Fe-4S dicluster domain-containing protein n=1 Tax=Propionispora sp. 2/2-37 TaxID=1677858 RepID=UPI0006BB78EA|nr:ferredoxin family protein [Propionispora sp. 2/2-37]CUH94624.1 hypothetical protein P22_0690 [Propionispora sp. 2/2-37]
MSIRIDKTKCVGCGQCRMVCPGSLLYADTAGKAEIRYPRDCWGCTSCIKECTVQAIRFYLGADIGGRGSFLYTKREGDLLHWTIVHPDGREQTITVDKNEANAY